MRLLVLLVSLFALTGTALAQTFVPAQTAAQDVTDFSGEHDEDTGVPAAREAGEAATGPVKILNVKWVNDASPIIFIEETNFDASGMLASLGGTNMILPGATGEFMAWYGNWADYNGDDHLPNVDGAYFGASLNSRSGKCADGQFSLTLFPNGDPAGGDPIPILPPQTVPAAVAADCREEEWTSIAGAVVAGYTSPNPPSDTLLSNNLVERPPEGEPNTPFGEGTFTEGTRYFTPATSFGNFFFDGSVLQTTTLETYVNALPTADGDRTITRNTAEPHDVDVYQTVSPAVESLYKSLVVDPMFAAIGCNPGDPWATVQPGPCLAEFNVPPSPADPVIEDVEEAVGPVVDPILEMIPDAPSIPVNSVVGPSRAQFFPSRGVEDTGYNYIDETHPYFDVAVGWWTNSALVAVASDSCGVGAATIALASSCGVSGDGTGRETAPVKMGIYGHLGLWNDENADGWIGAPTSSEDCPDDPHNCGATQDPNDYDSAEFTRYCRETTRPTGEVMATLSSSTGTWGNGIYKLHDNDFFGFTALGILGDNYEDRVGDNVGGSPYDDIVLDASDGSVDDLILTGDITVHLNCGGFLGPGDYHSFEKFLFPEGGNRGYEITLATESFSRTVIVNGTPVDEPISDIDVVPAMAPLV